MVTPLELGAGAAALYLGGKVLGILPASPAAAAPGTAPGAPASAPVPMGQSAAFTAQAAPAIPGHVIPVVPEPGDSANSNAFLQRLGNIAKGAGYVGGTDALPRVGTDGRWYDGQGYLFQFKDPSTGMPMGVPGYMPIEYKAYIAGSYSAYTGKSGDAASSGGGIDPSPFISAGTAAAVAAGTAAAGGGSLAAGVGAAAAAALAALGPVPSAKWQERGWSRSSVSTLTSRVGDKVIGVNVFRAPNGRHMVAAVETNIAAARELVFDPSKGLAAMYADHAHAVIGDFETESEAIDRATAYVAVWERTEAPPVDACPCDEIAVPS
jgi:hypothetical protein